MRPDQWRLFKYAAKGNAVDRIPVALIVDSPWMPGHYGFGHLDYYLQPDTWFEANRRLIEDLPDIIFFPSWWIEYGMAIEPSALGSRILFHPDQPPSQLPMLFRLADLDNLPPVNPQTDGFMALALHRYRTEKQRVFDAGFTIPVATARGALCSAAFLRGVNGLMTDLTDDPAGVHKLLDYTTTATIAWLQAQAEAIGDSVEGIFILDDIVGFFSRRSYLEFAHPYLTRICEAFPRDWVKVYHNDAKIRPFMTDLAGAGFDVLNWSHALPLTELRAAVGDRLVLMGNVAPLELGVRGTPEQVKAAALDVLRASNGEGVILSLGGGVSPGMPRENMLALCEAGGEFRRT
jgi:uroporphyrinogen decarboxylase